MTISRSDSDLQSAMNRANPNSLPEAFRLLGLGDVIRTLPTWLRGLNPDVAGADPYNLATVDTIKLPDDAKASVILRTTGKAGQTGEFTIEAFGVTPSGNNHVGVSPCGDIVFLAAGSVTDADVLYIPEKGDVVELTLPATASDEISLPASMAGAIYLLEAEATAGTVTGKKIVLIPTDTNPATGKAVLNLAKTKVLFASADAVTEARVKVLVKSAKDVSALLAETTSGVI